MSLVLMKQIQNDKHNNRLNNQKPYIIINEEHQEDVDSLTYLGVKIDRCLTWTDQIKKVCKTLCIKLSKLTRLRKTLNSKTLERIYHSLIQPSIDYAIYMGYSY